MHLNIICISQTVIFVVVCCFRWNRPIVVRVRESNIALIVAVVIGNSIVGKLGVKKTLSSAYFFTCNEDSVVIIKEATAY